MSKLIFCPRSLSPALRNYVATYGITLICRQLVRRRKLAHPNLAQAVNICATATQTKQSRLLLIFLSKAAFNLATKAGLKPPGAEYLCLAPGATTMASLQAAGFNALAPNRASGWKEMLKVYQQDSRSKQQVDKIIIFGSLKKSDQQNEKMLATELVNSLKANRQYADSLIIPVPCYQREPNPANLKLFQAKFKSSTPADKIAIILASVEQAELIISSLQTDTKLLAKVLHAQVFTLNEQISLQTKKLGFCNIIMNDQSIEELLLCAVNYFLSHQDKKQHESAN